MSRRRIPLSEEPPARPGADRDRSGRSARPDPPEEPSEGVLTPDPELEQALREAAEAVEREEREGWAADPSPGGGEVLLEEPVKLESHPAELERLRVELTETRDRLLRVHADFENFRRRAQREREEALLYGHQNLVKDLLATVDNLERAIDHARHSAGEDLEGLLQGVELVQRDLLGALAKHGVMEVEAFGRPFDPSLHEAMAQVPDASVPANTVVEVLQKGYRLRDRLLRPARVVVARELEAGEGGGFD